MRFTARTLRPTTSPSACYKRQKSWTPTGCALMLRIPWGRPRSVTWPVSWTSSKSTSTSEAGSLDHRRELDKHLESVHATFPDKPLVISEYGYCACTKDRPEGDTRRIEILRSHDAVIRSKDYVAGAIFFCYNDYRTHVGDRGVGVLQQNVHGVVDVYGAPKPSYETLRQESSPIESLTVSNQLNTFQLRLKSRRDIPMYSLRGYRLRGLFYGQGIIPVERLEVELPEITPGIETRADLTFSQSTTPLRVQFDVLRPTRFSAYSLDWTP